MPTGTTRALFVACSIIVLSCAGCSTAAPNDVAMPTASQSEAEVASPHETVTPDSCETSTAESIELLNAAMDRMDRASSAAEAEEASAPVNDLFTQAGENMGQHCGPARAGAAVSELIVWASSSASSRPPLSASFAEGFLGSVCDLDVELGIEFTPPAQVACAG